HLGESNMHDALWRWMDDYGDLGPEDVVVIAYPRGRLNDALKAGEVLTRRGIHVRSANARSLLDPDTTDFVRSSAAQRVVLLCVQRYCIGIDTIGGFLSTCGRYGKDVALRTISDSGELFLIGATPANGWGLGWYGH